MNRDEKLTRPTGLPPRRKKVNGRAVISPSEPGGGTWSALNDSGATFALINWYSITARVKSNPASRGDVVNEVSAADSVDEAALALAALPLKRMNPFRLIAVFQDTKEVVEWRWNLKVLSRRPCDWKTQQWISSGFDEPAAQRIRSQTFCTAQHQQSAGSLAWLRRLHRSHTPEIGPFSICMHRADAATISYTEVTVSSRQVTLRYHPGALCQNPREQLPPANSALKVQGHFKLISLPKNRPSGCEVAGTPSTWLTSVL